MLINFKGRIHILLIIIISAILSLLWLYFNIDRKNSLFSAYDTYKLKGAKSHLSIDAAGNILDTNVNIYNKANKIIFQGEKIVHVDLKGAPLKISYYEPFFKLLVKLGATGVLMEYEDMFPYHEPILSNISAGNAYSLKDIKTINNLARSMNLKIIPLIQTFGHMEFILKLKEWKHLREVPKYPLVICPSHNETLILLRELIEQMIKAHPYSNMIHIGADEVYLLGECDKCFVKMNINSWTKQKLFLNHVSTVATIIKEKHPNIRILMWDDEFRNVRQEDLEKWKIASLVEPVVWKYSPDVYGSLGSSLWEMYSNVFPRLWIASAFKGATGSNKYTTDIGYHLDNHKSWMQLVSEYSTTIKFEGIIITGWQRYDHFAVLCELLPVGIPSLAMSLYLIQGYIDSTLVPPQAVANLLKCENPYALLGPTLGTPRCNFPGGAILESVLKLDQLKKDFTNLMEDSVVKGWMDDYNVNHLYSNLMYVESAMENLDVYKMHLEQIEADLINHMNKMYDNYTITEWCETYIRPLNKQIERLWTAKEKLLSKEDWPKRPLTSENKEL